jgi:hypothetical protein
MKRAVFIVLLTFGLLMGIASISWGYGVFGPTDLMYTPTASSLDMGTLGIAVDVSEDESTYFNFDYGLAEDLEVGIVILTDPDSGNRIRFRGKYSILHEDRNTPGLAVGIEDLGSERPFSPFLVLSKAFPNSGIQGHIGVGDGNFQGIFGGLGVTFAGGSGKTAKHTELFLEFDSHRINTGAKLGIGANTEINFGMTDLENWMAGVTYIVK